MTTIAVPDPDLLTRAVRTFMNADADPKYLATPGTMVFVATEADEITGWCWGNQLARPAGPPMLYLHQLEVLEPYRGRGIGRALVSTFMTTGRTAGATKMFLTTGAHNTPARTLYESLGAGPATQGPTINYWFLL
ncbi:GNAT family N-acetyltransferase [Kribbella sp. NPDC051586]|uniref:GNAT family N-acetyltransferase n=1 Tax=Kribbella sp. NPDC051586 TaxID=3364118 RepID=UPI003794DDFA